MEKMSSPKPSGTAVYMFAFLLVNIIKSSLSKNNIVFYNDNDICKLSITLCCIMPKSACEKIEEREKSPLNNNTEAQKDRKVENDGKSFLFF